MEIPGAECYQEGNPLHDPSEVPWRQTIASHVTSSRRSNVCHKPQVPVSHYKMRTDTVRVKTPVLSRTDIAAQKDPFDSPEKGCLWSQPWVSPACLGKHAKLTLADHLRELTRCKCTGTPMLIAQIIANSPVASNEDAKANCRSDHHELTHCKQRGRQCISLIKYSAELTTLW
jgi:hypothetical protein